MSGEYGLKKDRDRKWFTGEFLWSGIDYLGEPTPYDAFPVKASFFGAVDTAGFPKDMYHLFKSQWTEKPMVHLLPMNWTDHRPGEVVDVWAYSNVDTVELFLSGKSLGTRKFDEKKTTDGRTYLETIEATGDDKTVTGGPWPGSYTSPNGSAGKLHLTWKVPFAPGELKAVARRDGRTVATDVLRTAGDPHALRLTSDRKSLGADGRSLCFVTAEVVDARGVVVPGADHSIAFDVDGESLAGVDNGREESAERYQASTRTAFHGKALAIVRSGTEDGSLTLRARSAGLRTADGDRDRPRHDRPKVLTPAADSLPTPDRAHPTTLWRTPVTRAVRTPCPPRWSTATRPPVGPTRSSRRPRPCCPPSTAPARRTGCPSSGAVPAPSTGSRSPSPSTPRTPCPLRWRSPPGTGAAIGPCGEPTSTGPPRPTRRRWSPSTRYAAPGSGSR
ncbi:hypothetical protein QF035_001500 [Streptomyces umbrinus]|uniref:Beta-galactosidase n=1 Tax=Streptomyces umbrinus TaxID=67370 RepID=A0ABU0SK79_9ACTN|nr:hypothetical protein [Streptomyces umbrinus]